MDAARPIASLSVRPPQPAPRFVLAAWTLAVGTTLAACTPLEEVPPGTIVTCTTSDDCPSDDVCNRGRCVAPEDLGVPPDLVGGTVGVAPAKGTAGTTFTLTLEATRALEAPPRVILGMDPLVEPPCASTGGNTYACTWVATGTENGGMGGRVSIDVRMVDLVGTETARNGVGALDLDFSAPTLAARSAEPAAARLGSVLQVFFATDEALGQEAVLVASRPLDEPGDGTRFALSPQPGTRNYVFTHMVTLADAAGPIDFTVELVDEVGNAATALPVGTLTVDNVAPIVSNLAVSPPRLDASGTLQVTLDTDEEAAGSPTATVGGRPMACGAHSPVPPSYTCTRAMMGDEIPAGSEAAQSVVVTLADAAGNATTASGSTVFDFRPPGVAGATVAYAPPAGSAIPSVARAAAGARVTVTVLADEALDATAPPSLVATRGPDTLPFTWIAAASTMASATFETVVPPGLPDGDYTLALTWTDVAGNAATTGAGLPPVSVKTSAPTLVVDQAALVFVRSPLGNAATEPLGDHVIPAGPYFAVEPSDPLSPSATLPAGALLLDDGTVPVTVIVQAASGADALVLGTMPRDGSGLIPRRKLVSPDLAGVWLVGVDDAGNRSGAVKLETSEWIVTPSDPAFGYDPNQLVATGYATSTRAQDLVAAAMSEPGADGIDTTALLAVAAGTWQPADWDGVSPSARSDHAMAWDAARGRAVLFGGTTTGGYAADTWEWDGTRWTQRATAGPSGRAGHAMAWDAARGRAVLFGGIDAFGYTSDTWEWDGTDWVRVATSGPGERTGHAMAYDSLRRRVVLFGGVLGANDLGDTWEWDGNTWTRVATSGPSARADSAMAFDERRGRTVLFGGGDYWYPYRDIWEWNGTAWTYVSYVVNGRYGHAMAYDRVRQRVVIYGGRYGYDFDPGEEYSDWLDWDGAIATPVIYSGGWPGPRHDHGIAYDAARGRMVVFGGHDDLDSPLQDTWTSDGSSMALVSSARPAARTNHAMAYDAERGQVVLFGGAGVQGDTWTWDGRSWRQAATTGPGARLDHAMAWDPVRKQVILFGGIAGSTLLQDTWAWNGTGWTLLATTGPSPRRDHALAFDSASGRLILFGGFDGTALSQETWAWNGSAWSLVTSSGPSARRYHALASDTVRGRVVLFGGRGSLTTLERLQDTWELTGSTWSQVATTGPEGRIWHAMTFDALRGRVVLFGGLGAIVYQDTWEWDGASWSKVAAAGPSARWDHALAYDAARGRTILFGGTDAGQDTWAWNAAPSHQPALQFEASVGTFGVPLDRITRLAVRAFAGGTFVSGGAGATLLGWTTRGPSGEPGAWMPLAANATGLSVSPPYLPAYPASLLAWQSLTADEARRFVVDRDGITVQVRPDGTAGNAPGGAAVALDYVEVRVRYQVP